MNKQINCPYHFVPLHQKTIKSEAGNTPIAGHDVYTESGLSGELRCELQTLTPAIFGALQAEVDAALSTKAQAKFGSKLAGGKSVVLPNQVNINGKPLTLLQGSSLAGMARHNLSALTSSPMLRVQEKSFSYRPNATFLTKKDHRIRKIKPFVATVFCNNDKVLSVDVYPRLPTAEVEFKYAPDAVSFKHYSHTDRQGYLSKLFSEQNGEAAPRVKTTAYVKRYELEGSVRLKIEDPVKRQFEATTAHLCDGSSGHLSTANPMIKEELLQRLGITKQELAASIRANRDLANWPENLLIFVDAEVDEDGRPEKIVSFGNNFRYHWCHSNTTTQFLNLDSEGGATPRLQVKPLQCELEAKPSELSMVSSMFGMIRDGEEPFKVAGKVSFNHAIEALDQAKTVADQDIWAALDQSGQPKPSAYEHYLLQQQGKPLKWYSDKWMLAGRKYYLHQEGFNAKFTKGLSSQAAYVHSQDGLADKNAPLVAGIIPTNKKFLFTARFRNLSRFEMGGLVLSLSPQLMTCALQKTTHPALQALVETAMKHPLAIKMGYGKPQGYGSAKISIRHSLLHSEEDIDVTQLAAEFLDRLYQRTLDKQPNSQFANQAADQLIDTLKQWIKVHSFVAGQTAVYPTPQNSNDIFSYHKQVRDFMCKTRRVEKLTDTEKQNIENYKLTEL